MDVRHMLEFTARNREHVLFRRSLENAHLKAKRHLHDRLGQIDRLDNARILESSGISESAHYQNEQEKYCEIPHDTLQNGVGSREICVDSSLPKSGLFLPSRCISPLFKRMKTSHIVLAALTIALCFAAVEARIASLG